MAESNADKYYKLGQIIQKKSSEVEHLKEIMAKGGEAAEVTALKLKSKYKELAELASNIEHLKNLKGIQLGTVLGAAKEAMGKRAMVAAGPIGLALSTLDEASASEDVGPEKDSPAYKLENNIPMSKEEESKLAVGGLPSESPENYLNDGGTPEETLGKAVETAGKLRSTNVDKEMKRIRSEYPEFKNVSDEDLTKSILDKNKADGGLLKKVKADQLGMGIRTELEHTDDANIAMKIAMDHLNEDSSYYSKLEKVEKKKLKDGGKTEEGLTAEEKALLLEEREELKETFKHFIPEHKVENKVENKVDEDVDWSFYKKGEGKERIKKALENYKKLKKGGFVPGDEDQYAGDTVDAKLNKDELVLNVEQQQKLADKLSGKKTELPKHDRIDNLLNREELAINPEEQEKLFAYIKGETSEKPNKIIVRAAEGIPNAALPQGQQYTGPEVNPIDTSNVVAEPNMTPINPPVQNVVPEIASASVPTTAPMEIDPVKKLQTSAIEEQLAKSEATITAAKKQAATDQLAINDANNQREIAAAKDKEISDNIFKELNEQDSKVKAEREKSGLSNFFEKESTLGKIFFGAALAIGTLASFKTGSNPILNYISKTIDDDLEKSKLSKDMILAKKNAYYDFQKLQIERQMSQTDNTRAKQQGQLVISQIEKIQSDINLQRAQMAMAKQQQQNMQNMMSGAQKSGIPVANLKMLPKELQETAVVTSEGKVKFAADKERAQKVTEYQNDVIPAIAGAKRILETAKDINRVTDLTKRGIIATELKALAGQLRLPFTGPGILTDKEFDRLMDTLGDPTKLAAFPSIQRAKLETVIDKLNTDLRQHYKNAGIPIEDTINDKNIAQLKKDNPGLSTYEAEKALKAKGFWKDN